MYNFESGLPVSQTVDHLCQRKEMDDESYRVSQKNQDILDQYSFEGYYCGRSDGWAASEFHLYPSGDTLMKKETISIRFGIIQMEIQRSFRLGSR